MVDMAPRCPCGSGRPRAPTRLLQASKTCSSPLRLDSAIASRGNGSIRAWGETRGSGGCRVRLRADAVCRGHKCTRCRPPYTSLQDARTCGNATIEHITARTGWKAARHCHAIRCGGTIVERLALCTRRWAGRGRTSSEIRLALEEGQECCVRRAVLYH